MQSSILRPVSVAFVLLFVAHGVASSAFAQSVCPGFDDGHEVGRITDPEIAEASGLAASWANPGVLWVHNDSGDSPRIFAIDEKGETLTVATLSGVTALDWEDLAIGPCEAGSPAPCIYVGDIGDNDSERDDIRIHRFPEPALGPTPPTTLTIDALDTFVVTYADGPRNAEALLVHPSTGAVFVVDKTIGDPNNVWRIPTDAPAVIAEKVASFDLEEPILGGGLITAADFAPSGDALSVRTYAWVYTFCGTDIAEALNAPFVKTRGFQFLQGETLAYARDGRSMWVTSEFRTARDAPLVQMRLVEPVSAGPEPEPTDMGTPPPDAPAASPAPSPDARGCSCAQTKAGTAFGAPGLLLLLALSWIRRR